MAAAIVIFINHQEADTLHTEVLPIIASLLTVLLRVIRKVRIVAIVATQRRTAPEKAPMTLMMTDMTISTWNGDYDYDRYDSDSDYADGVDDAMDETGEDW